MNKYYSIIFIVLDGTLITTRSGNKFPLHSEDWKFKLNWYDVLANYNYDKICIIGNQFSLGKGYASETLFNKKIENICKILEKDLALANNSILTSFCFKEEETFRALPDIGMLYEVALDYEIPITNCLLIGNNEDVKVTANKTGADFVDILDFI